jgi:hypothetical protein
VLSSLFTVRSYRNSILAVIASRVSGAAIQRRLRMVNRSFSMQSKHVEQYEK